MKALQLSDDLRLPLDAVTQTFGVLAVRGAGKSNAAVVMAEEFHDAGLPFVAIDPKGDWWGIRARGEAPGLPVPVFGGDHADVPLERTSGALVADLLVDKRFSCVLDVSEFSEGDKVRFLIDFAERLLRRNREPLHVFCEEADDYIPQRPLREQARLVGAFQRLIKRGRFRGLGCTLVTQRSAALNKDVLYMVETLFLMRTLGPRDRAAAEGWIEHQGQSDEVLAELPSMESGEAFVYSPNWLRLTLPKRIRFRRRRTFDSGATPVTGKSRPAASMAAVDLDAVKAAMAETIEKARHDDPKVLRSRIAVLEGELEKARHWQGLKAEVRVEVPVLEDEKVGLLTQWGKVLREEVARIQDIGREVDAAARDIIAVVDRHVRTKVSVRAPAVGLSGASRPRLRRHNAEEAAPSPGRPSPSPLPSGDLTGPEQRILDALAWFESIGVMMPRQSAVAFLAGYSWKGSAYRNPRSRLNTQGLITLDSSCITLTEKGRTLARKPETPLTAAALQAEVFRRLPGPEKRILEPLLRAYPDWLTNEETATRAGYSAAGSAYRNPRSRLRSLDLIHVRDGHVRAAGLLFLEDL